jgi:NADH dehydrogenase [ubiquinone] 1 alpha subcomplex assembly factor 1
MSENTIVIFDFKSNSNVSTWRIVNDAVMGGASLSSFSINDFENGVFEGSVSLENNGGFCSVHYSLSALNLKTAKQFLIRLKGDGKTYQFRAKSNQEDKHSYVFEFQTSGDWQTIAIPFSKMHPAFRGQVLNIPNYDGKVLAEIAFLIGNKKAETFQLLLDTIEVK